MRLASIVGQNLIDIHNTKNSPYRLKRVQLKQIANMQDLPTSFITSLRNYLDCKGYSLLECLDEEKEDIFIVIQLKSLRDNVKEYPDISKYYRKYAHEAVGEEE